MDVTSAVRKLELMTTVEVANSIASGARTAIIPCGAVEQHGPHLPLSVDADHADHLGSILVSRIGNAMLAPTVRVGCSSHHLEFSGTISLRESTLEAILLDYCTSLASHGFEKIFIFTAHVGNCPALADMLPRLQAAVPDCRISAFTDSRTWLETWRDAVDEAGGDAIKVGGHADLAETSVMLDIHPDRVRAEAYQAGTAGLPSPADLEKMWRDGLRSLSPNGILGDPHGANDVIGRHCVERIAALLLNSFGQPVAN